MAAWAPLCRYGPSPPLPPNPPPPPLQVVCRRALGSASSDCVRIMAEVLRLTIMCASSAAGYQVADERARDLTGAVDRLAAADPHAARGFGGRVTELTALAALLAAGQETVKVRG